VYDYIFLFYFSRCSCLEVLFNLLPFLFKALLHGQKDRVFFSGHVIYILKLERLDRQGTFKSRALWSVRDSKGFNMH
jgi:hypothetical protein